MHVIRSTAELLRELSPQEVRELELLDARSFTAPVAGVFFTALERVRLRRLASFDLAEETEGGWRTTARAKDFLHRKQEDYLRTNKGRTS